MLQLLAGLGSILFAISFDRAELNGSKPATGLNSLISRHTARPTAVQSTDDTCPVAASLTTKSPKCTWLHCCCRYDGQVVCCVLVYLRQWRRYMFSPVCPRLFVCLSVCLCARLLKNACMEDEMFRVRTWTN